MKAVGSRPCELFSTRQRQQVGSTSDTSAEEKVAALFSHSNVRVSKVKPSGPAFTSICTSTTLELLFQISALNAPLVPNQRIS
jgi:hypothetical protein